MTGAWIPSSVSAQSQPDIRRARITKSTPAPFDGVLLTDAALAKLITDAEARLAAAQLETEKLRRDLELERRTSEAVWQARLDAEKMKLAACSKSADRTLELLDKATSPAPWYRSPYLHFILGSAISGGVCAAATRIK